MFSPVTEHCCVCTARTQLPTLQTERRQIAPRYNNINHQNTVISGATMGREDNCPGCQHPGAPKLIQKYPVSSAKQGIGKRGAKTRQHARAS
jgi:hypothetical protein